MVNGDRWEFSNAEVVDDSGLVLRCRIEGRVVGIPPLRLLEGTEIRHKGDRGRLVLGGRRRGSRPRRRLLEPAPPN
jgi:hypothetical protein